MSIGYKPKDYTTLFLDMNSFFASVEQQVRPELRGQPVGVAPYIGSSGCIIAASYEAKAQGIKISRVGDAKKICPQIKILEARPALYMLYHKEIKKVLEKFTPYFQPLSIDEFAIRLTPQDQGLERSVALARKIKQAIFAEVGDYMRCSIGIGPSVFLAKMAGERQKPDGLTVVTLKELEKFYSGLKLTDLVGINWRLESRLKNFGINSPIDLFKKPVGELVRVLNHPGRLWYFRLRGFEVDDFVIKNKTIGHSHVLSPEFRTKEAALSVLRKLVFKVGYRIRKEKYQAGGVSVVINFLNQESFHLSKKFPPFCDDNTFRQYVYSLLKNCPWRGRPILIAVSAFNLIKPTGDQISIFDDVEKSKEISKAMDDLNDQYGADTVFPASMFQGLGSAPDRIPFGMPRHDIRF